MSHPPNARQIAVPPNRISQIIAGKRAAKAVPSEGMANLLRLALENPDLFTKPVRDAVNWPSAEDTRILRRAITDDRLGALVRRIYPQTDAGDDMVAGY